MNGRQAAMQIKKDGDLEILRELREYVAQEMGLDVSQISLADIAAAVTPECETPEHLRV